MRCPLQNTPFLFSKQEFTVCINLFISALIPDLTTVYSCAVMQHVSDLSDLRVVSHFNPKMHELCTYDHSQLDIGHPC